MTRKRESGSVGSNARKRRKESVGLVKGSLQRYVSNYMYPPPTLKHHKKTRGPRRMHRWCIQHLVRYLETFPAQAVFHMLTYLDRDRVGLQLRRTASSEQRSYDALQARLADLPKVAGSTLHRCGKCEQTDVEYFQKQCRSADEPMTCFFTCQSCGNRWKT